MISFQDMTFCAALCGNDHCGRRWTTELQAQADKWWSAFGDEHGAPVAFSNFKDSAPYCPGFVEPVEVA